MSGSARGPRETVACTHCGLPVPPALRSESGPSFCCTGCRLVHAMLVDEGLGDFYRLRDRTGGDRPGVAVDAQGLEAASAIYAHYDGDDFAGRFVQEAADGARCVRLFVEGVHCAACVWLMDQLPRVMPGVEESRLDLARQELMLRWDPERASLGAIGAFLHRLGYPSHARGREAEEARRREARRETVRLGVAFAIAGNAMMIAAGLYAGEISADMAANEERVMIWLSLLLAIPAVTYCAAPFHRGAWSGLRVGVPHMDLPISLGILAGFSASAWATVTGGGHVYFDSVTTLVFLLLLGRWVLRRGQRAALAGSELMSALAPATARRLTDGVEHVVPVDELALGDVVAVARGAVFPIDGRLLAGETHVDSSLLTGESRPERVAAGAADRVLAGTRNLARDVEVEVLATGAETRVARLVELTERAGDARAPVVRLADRISGWFVLGVLAVAAAAGVGWWRVDPSRVFDVVVSVLIVSCPCALGMATPVALAVARGRAARAGFLVRSGAAIERIAGARTLFLDKTGTLTEGRLAVSAAWVDEESASPEAVARWVATLEARSGHPVASALGGWARRQLEGEGGAEPVLSVPADWRELPGKGVEATLDGARVALGSVAWAGTPEVVERVDAVAAAGASPVVLRRGKRAVAVLAVDDRVRAEAPAALARFRALGLEPTILSGDHPGAVERVAGALGIERLHAQSSPEEKAALVAAAPRSLMVGDGVNDAPALRAAFAGIAVAGGAEAALGVADAYLADPGLSRVVELVEGSRRALGVVRRNLVFSLAYNATFATLAVLGHITPLAAAVLMPLSSLSVVGSSVLSRSFRAPAPAVGRSSAAVAELDPVPASG